VSYHGKTWAVQHVPAPGKGLSDDFEGVSCPSAANCVAVGLIGPANSTALSLLSGVLERKGLEAASREISSQALSRTYAWRLRTGISF
jgi:hypothetical protein